jgi:hypothetical protein
MWLALLLGYVDVKIKPNFPLNVQNFLSTEKLQSYEN